MKLPENRSVTKKLVSVKLLIEQFDENGLRACSPFARVSPSACKLPSRAWIMSASELRSLRSIESFCLRLNFLIRKKLDSAMVSVPFFVMVLIGFGS